MIGTLRVVTKPTATTVENPLAFQEQVCFALAVASRSVMALYSPVLEPMGLTHPQYLVMLAFWEHDPVSGRDLSRLLQLDPGTLSPLLKRLEAAGLHPPGAQPRRRAGAGRRADPRGACVATGKALKVPPAIVERLGMDIDELKISRGG